MSRWQDAYPNASSLFLLSSPLMLKNFSKACLLSLNSMILISIEILPIALQRLLKDALSKCKLTLSTLS